MVVEKRLEKLQFNKSSQKFIKHKQQAFIASYISEVLSSPFITSGLKLDYNQNFRKSTPLLNDD